MISFRAFVYTVTMVEDPSSSGPIVRFADGEYYSPMYDTRELAARKEQLWPAVPRATVGIDWRASAQLSFCRDVFAQQSHFEFPFDATENATEYFAYNGMYPPLDAWILENMIRHYRPARMIEIGCGYSTLVSARVNREVFDSQIHLSCIEPYPRPFLTDGVVGVNEVLIQKIQDVPLDYFERLMQNDILFIDTSHTVKTGGDVTWMFHEILPRLAPGVLVHIHDFYLPGEYPESWVLEGWGWNETYLVQSFLMFNDVFEILWGSLYMLYKYPNEVKAAFPNLQRYTDQGTGSLWIRRRR
jgi:predicted O-methyltransferase YrrM